MKKILITILSLFLTISSFAQDIVYDTIYGTKANWFRIKTGPNEIFHKIAYENQATIVQSKVLSAAGLLNGLEKNVDYRDYFFNYDTLTYEFETDVPLNVIVYKYQVNETVTYYFVAIRKASLGSGMFEGQYMFISPVAAPGCEVKVYNGIGTNRQLFLDLKQSEISDADISDYMVSNKVTIQGIKVSKILRASKTRDILTDIIDGFIYNIEFWPNPVSDQFTLRIIDNKGVLVQIFDYKPTLVYEENITSEETIINVSSFLPGFYAVVIIDKKTGLIIDVLKIIKQ